MFTVIVTIVAIGFGPRVRATDPVIGSVLKNGVQESATIQQLVARIEASDLVVYLSRGDCPRPAVACLMMAGHGSGTRYVRINFRLPDGLGRARAWRRDDLSVQIAHELQHAAEIAGWADVIDAESLQRAYRRRHLDRGGAHVDTDAAIAAGRARQLELDRVP